MRKHVVRKLVYVLFLVLLTNPIEQAVASSTGQTAHNSSTAPTVTADGITGTDPEPISPNIVSIILTLLQLS